MNLEVTVWFHSFLRKYLPDSPICQRLDSSELGPMSVRCSFEKKGHPAGSSHSRTATPWGQASLRCAEGWCASPVPSHRTVEVGLLGPASIRWVLFTASSRAFWSEVDFFFFFFTGSEAAKNTVINTAPMGVTARSTPKHGVSPSAACAPPVGKLKGKRKWLSVQQCPHLQGVRSKTTVDAWNCR